MKRTCLIFLFISLFCGEICSENRLAFKAKMHPVIGCFITKLHDFDYQDNKFKVGGYSWVQYDNKKYDPKNSLEISNSESYVFQNAFFDQKDNLFFTGMNFTATCFHQWDMKNFPFDTQVLKIRFEDDWYDANKLEFVADTKNSSLAEDINIPGWEILDYKVESKVHVYRTSFGVLPNSQHKKSYLNTGNIEKLATSESQFIAIVTIKRTWVRPFFNYFSSLFLSFILCVFALIISPTEIKIKFSLTLGSVFAVVSNSHIIALMPVATGFTLADRIEAATFVFVMSTVAFNSCEIFLHQKNEMMTRKKAMIILVPSMIIFYIIFVGASIYNAASSTA